MDPISYSKASQQELRIKKVIAEPDSTSGLVTLPSTIAVGETITIPVGRTVVHPNLQVDGTLDVQGTLFIPSGGSVSTTEVDATVVKQNGNVVANLNSPSLTGIPTAPTAAVGTDTTQLATCALVKASMELAPRMQLMTAQNSTSGTAIDFTGIPSWVKKITVMFSGVSTNGSSTVQIQLGTSSGVENTAYKALVSYGGGAIGQYSNLTTGFPIEGANASATTTVRYGAITFTLSNSNIWVGTSSIFADVHITNNQGAGSKTLSGTLDRLRVTTVNGTDTFDAGQINVLYEG